jgi:DNA-binding response OmpR family regulator
LTQNSTQPIVVVADDDPSVRQFLDRTLTEAGYTVRTAMDVREGLRSIRLPGVAAVILDMLFVNSAGYSGLDLLRHIRAEPHLQYLPVVILTGFELNRTVVAEVEALHAELWHKPIGPRDLIERLHTLVNRRPPPPDR